MRRLIMMAGLLVGGSAWAQDSDGDGVPDATDNCIWVANGALEDDQADSDQDGLGDACDPSINWPSLFDPRVAALLACLDDECSKFDIDLSGEVEFPLDPGLVDSVLGNFDEATDPDGDPDMPELVSLLVELANGQISDGVVLEFFSGAPGAGEELASDLGEQLGLFN